MNAALMVATAIPEQFCQVTDEAMKATVEWLEEAAVVPDVIANDSQLALAAEILAAGKTLLRAGEKCRVDVKEPYLKAGRQIDQMHKVWAIEPTKEVNRIQKAIADREMALLKEQRAREAAAVAEAARLEQERLKKIQEANAEADCDKRRELSMQAKEIGDAKQEVKLAAIQPARKETGVKATPTWVGTVVDAAAVYRVRPDLCDIVVSQARLNDAIRGGMRVCDGVLIKEEMRIR